MDRRHSCHCCAQCVITLAGYRAGVPDRCDRRIDRAQARQCHRILDRRQREVAGNQIAVARAACQAQPTQVTLKLRAVGRCPRLDEYVARGIRQEPAARHERCRAALRHMRLVLGIGPYQARTGFAQLAGFEKSRRTRLLLGRHRNVLRSGDRRCEPQ